MSQHGPCSPDGAMTTKSADVRGRWTACERSLQADRVLAETMLDVLEAVLDRLERGGRVDPHMLDGVLRFFQDFVHDSHDSKVLGVMTALAARHAPIERFDAAERVHAHRDMREGLREVRALMPRLLKGRAERPTLFARAYRFVADSRRRLCLERVLLSGLEEVLAPEEDESLAKELARIEREAIGPTGREWYTQVALDYRDIVSTWQRDRAQA